MEKELIQKGGQPWMPAVVAIYRVEVDAGICGAAPEDTVFASFQSMRRDTDDRTF